MIVLCREEHEDRHHDHHEKREEDLILVDDDDLVIPPREGTANTEVRPVPYGFILVRRKRISASLLTSEIEIMPQ